MNEQELIELRKYACSHLGLDENEWLLNKTDYFVMRRRIVYLYLFFKGKKIVDIAKDAGKLPQTVTFAIYTTIENIMVVNCFRICIFEYSKTASSVRIVGPFWTRIM